MRVAIVQLSAGLDPAQNVETIHRLAEPVEADMIVFPEAAMHDFGPTDMRLGPVAQRLDGPFVASLGDVARKRRATVIAGMFEVSDDPERPYNTLVALGSDGSLLGSYRKTHLYDSFGYQESARLSAASPLASTIVTGGFRAGMLTCYDLRFPEHARALIEAGADVLVVPAAWLRGPMKEDHWTTLLRARAIENTAYVVAAAQYGRTYCGLSMIVDPMGVPVAALGEAEGVATADLQPERLRAVRERNPALGHRRWRVEPGIRRVR